MGIYECILCFCFQLTQNVKAIHKNASRIQLTLKDTSVITLDKLSPTLAQRTQEYLEKLKQGVSGNVIFAIHVFIELFSLTVLYFTAVLKSSHGSANLSVLGNRSIKNDSSPSVERQVCSATLFQRILLAYNFIRCV